MYDQSQTSRPDSCHHGGCHSHEHSGIFGERTELIFAISCGAFLLAGTLISWLTTWPAWIAIACFAVAYFFGGYYATIESLDALGRRQFEIDFLMVVAAVGSAFLGGWAEGALLLFLFSLGHSLEHFAMGRARRAIESLAELAPRSANVRRNGMVEEIGVEDLAVDDVVIVKPNERLAADGFVLTGESSVNQAPITGESLPVDKSPVPDRTAAATKANLLPPEHQVFAGTINGAGAMEIQVTRVASDSTLARVVKMVNEAESQRSPTQRFTDRFEKYFVPVVLVFVVLLLFAFLIIDEPFSASFYRAMAVLIAASPCALAISTPSAVLSGIARAARGGVLIKGGGPLEELGQLKAIAFDKTGTLTEGNPKLTDVVTFGPTTEKQLLQVAIAIERLSDHPLAGAVVRGGESRMNGIVTPSASDLKNIVGRGVSAMVDGKQNYLGKPSLFDELDDNSIPEDLRSNIQELEQSGRTTMVLRQGNDYLGAIGVMDTPRESAGPLISRLRELGIQRMIMISGDNQNVANAVAKEVGLDEAFGDLMPEQKVDAIKRMAKVSKVAMIGDGVNDAPAMASAAVGIAMGAAGSAVALETADVALMGDDLEKLGFAIGLGRQTSKLIRQNLWISLGMVAVLVPATLLGLQISFAVIFHEGSTIAVVLNALRLLAYSDSNAKK